MVRSALATWLKLINDSLPLYKLAFKLRKKSALFNKIWGKWMSSPLTLTSLDPGY